MRLPVVDTRGIPLMPCHPAKARRRLAQGKAQARWSKLGLFYIQLTWEQEPHNQPLAVGVDPGATYEGYAVVGKKDTILNLMAEAPTHVTGAVQVRRTMRRARRARRCRRRPARFHNRLAGHRRIPPSTRARWEAKARVVAHLRRILPLTDVVVEDVRATTRQGKGGPWNARFSPIQAGKEHLYSLLRGMSLTLWTKEGWQTKELREHYGLKKSRSKRRRSFESHAVDAWVLAASTTGATQPTCRRLWYVVTIRMHRRQLHRLQCAKGGVRHPYGGTRAFGFKRGTLVRHARYGLASVGGCDRRKGTLSLHEYRTNTRLTQRAKGTTLVRLTWTPYRTYLVSKTRPKSGLKPLKRGAPPYRAYARSAGGFPRLKASSL
jgi:RRXRR protein